MPNNSCKCSTRKILLAGGRNTCSKICPRMAVSCPFYAHTATTGGTHVQTFESRKHETATPSTKIQRRSKSMPAFAWTHGTRRKRSKRVGCKAGGSAVKPGTGGVWSTPVFDTLHTGHFFSILESKLGNCREKMRTFC